MNSGESNRSVLILTVPHFHANQNSMPLHQTHLSIFGRILLELISPAWMQVQRIKGRQGKRLINTGERDGESTRRGVIKYDQFTREIHMRGHGRQGEKQQTKIGKDFEGTI